jgi:tRNA pseudouridine38-40 synthase
LSGAAVRWRLDLAYDGRGFNGFAEQSAGDTVVGRLRDALALTCRLAERPAVVGAGRTDAGVHAFAQVVHVDLPASLSVTGPTPERLTASLNRLLAGRIRVTAARAASPDFHARFSATWREYRYLVLEESPPALGLTSAWSWSVAGPLDVAAMNAAAAQAVGTHDFRSFCRRPAGSDAAEPLLREVLAAAWERVADPLTLSPSLAVVRLDIRANAFCHHMVRCLVSTMVAVGQGRLGPDVVAQRLATPDRAHLPPLAPPGGLCLVGVGYPELAGGPSGFVG